MNFRSQGYKCGTDIKSAVYGYPLCQNGLSYTIGHGVLMQSPIDGQSHMHEGRMRWCPLALITILVIVTLMGINMWGTPSLAQGVVSGWSPQQTIPGYGDETNPPILIADQNKTVHAFASQLVGEDNALMAITYNQWSLESGWTEPNDILLSPIKQQAQLLDVFLDKQGVFHVIFFGGDETEANLYYAKALAAHAAEASAWSVPEPIVESMVPASGAITEDAQGNIIVMYGSRQEGNGVYVIDSNDRGASWSDPAFIGPTYSEKLFPFSVQVVRSPDGILHSIWQVVNVAGQGRGIFYSRSDADRKDWTNPVDLSEGEKMTELGTMTPAIVIYKDILFVLYNVRGRIVMRRSEENGQRWDASSEIFAQHVGVNGPPSFVIDSNDQLHMLFAQRITGSPDIHGVWHSKWLGNNWSGPVAVVSGPQVPDLIGDKAFDPVAPRVIVSQGNTLLVVWRQDSGLKGNGVWFSHQVLDAPALAPEALPSPISVSAVSRMPESTRVAVVADTPSAVSPLVLEGSASETVWQSVGLDGQAAPIAIGLVPVLILMVSIIVWNRRR